VSGLTSAARWRLPGSYRFPTLLVATSRQAGKSTLLQVVAVWRMYVDGAPPVLGPAQNLWLAEETWQGAFGMAEAVPELARELARELAHVSRTNGDKYLPDELAVAGAVCWHLTGPAGVRRVRRAAPTWGL
jgi:hypothetical protein